MNLIIFTQTYPSCSSGEQTFIGRELPYLSQHFKKIIIVPQTFSDQHSLLPGNTQVESRFSTFYKKQGMLGVIRKALLSPLFYQELLQRPSILLHPQMLLRLVKFVGDAELTKKWAKKWIRDGRIDVNNTLFYSFWFTQIAMGLGLLKKTYSNLKTIARGHGYDIYEERYTPSYFPCRTKTLNITNKLFLASDNARLYMKKKYPEFSSNYQTAHLGVNASGFITDKSQDNVFRIVSCSSLIPLKRVELLAKSIALLAKIRPEQKVNWIHFGEGKSKQKIQTVIDQFPSSVFGELRGFVPNKEIIKHYKNHPTDVFVNLSTTEGIPVSIMEAISCGIPVIVTNVGGNSEIVSEENGILLGANPTPEEITHAFFELIDSPNLALEKRKGSLKIWKEKYDASKNFDEFALQVASMLKD